MRNPFRNMAWSDIGMLTFSIIWVLFILSLIAGAGYVLVHFIIKYW